MKIHSDIHEYKCGLCGRGFKNAKQRKHHVRMHRLRSNPPTKLPVTASSVTKAKVKCNQCPMTFANTVALESHIIDLHTPVLEKKDLLTNLPESIVSTNNAHAIKKHKCPECNYESNDHNAVRRHKFQHSKDSLYKCPFCMYSSIQSTTYRKHLEKQHPDKAANFVFKCQYSACKFTTISKQKFECHVTRHKSKGDHLNVTSSDFVTSKVVSNKPEIKVRKILTLTDPVHVSPELFGSLENEMDESQDMDPSEYVTTVNDSDSL